MSLPGNPGDQPTNPKAAAAAAKAFAKASRPWFKKKRYILLIAIVLIAISSAASGGGSSDDGPKAVSSSDTTESGGGSGTKDDGEKKDDDKVGEKGNPAKVGQTIQLEGTRYTVKSAHTAAQVGSEYMPEKADGIFIIVEFTIENTKDETKTFLSEAAKFLAADGTEYDVDSDAAIMGSGDADPLILKEMHPDLPTTGQLIFDVPPTKVKGGVLEVGDLFGSDKAYLKLGLK